MRYLFCYFLLTSSYEFPVYEQMKFLRPSLHKVCVAFQVLGPNEDPNYVYFRNEVKELRWRYKELKNAPVIETALMLPSKDECDYVVGFWDTRIKYLETAAKLHGTYRYVDFVDAIDFSKEEMYRWQQRAKATDVSRSYLGRRLALQWLRDECD